MVNADLIRSFIDNIPLILEYFIPGYCAIYFYRRLRSASNDEPLSESVQFGASVIISYLLVIILDSAGKLPFIPTVTAPQLRCLVEILLGFVGAALTIRLMRYPSIRKYYSRINNTTLSRTVFECCDLPKGPQVTVHMEDKYVNGRLLVYNDEEQDSWLALDLYEVYQTSHNLLDHWTYHDKYSRYLIPLSEVKSIEVHYKDESKLSPEWYQKKRKEVQKLLKKSDSRNQE